jgi:ribonuclease-3
VKVGGRSYGTGAGRSKKEAEQQAAEAAWKAISNGHDSAAGSNGVTAAAGSADDTGTPGDHAAGPGDDAAAAPGDDPAGG